MNVFLTDYEIIAIFNILHVVFDGSNVMDLDDYEKNKIQYDILQHNDDSLVYKFDVLKRLIDIKHEQNKNQSK